MQAVRWRPKLISLATEELADQLSGQLRGAGVTETEVVYGTEGTVACSTLAEADFVVSAIVGVTGLEATHAAILAGKPDFEECLINLVTIGMARKDAAMISDYSEKLLTVRPNSQTALEGLATCAFTSGDYEAALRYSTKLTEYTPESFDRWFNLGVAQQKTECRTPDPRGWAAFVTVGKRAPEWGPAGGMA